MVIVIIQDFTEVGKKHLMIKIKLFKFFIIMIELLIIIQLFFYSILSKKENK